MLCPRELLNFMFSLTMFSFVFFIQIIVLAKLDSINALTRASLGSYFVEQMGDFSCKVLVTSLRSKRFGWQAPEKATYGNLHTHFTYTLY